MFLIEIFFLTKKGRILKIERFNDDSCISSKDDFIYSIFGKLKVLNLYEEGKLKWKVKTLKHSKTFLETETVDVETGMLKTIYEIEYINGLQIKQTIRESNTTLINKCKRDKTGNEIEMSREINGEVIIEISKYKYFEFDNKGNWIKRIYFIPDDTDCNLIIRKLDYY